MRRRIKSVSLSPHKTGLCGCWRFIAVERVTTTLSLPKALQTPTTEIAFYASSHTEDEKDDAQLLRDIIGHWDAIENGVHRVRDVTFGEDACRVARPNAARNRVTLCNLAIGLFNLERKQGRSKALCLPSWRRSMAASAALRRINQ